MESAAASFRGKEITTMFMPRMHRAGGMILCLAGLAFATGCTRKLDDNQILQTVQSKIHANTAISGDVSAQSSDGVVTLHGQVNNDAARQLASREAADVPGVRTVVNNLTVAAPAAATPDQTEAAKPAAAPRPRERIPGSRKRAREVVKEAANTPPPAPEPESAPVYTPPLPPLPAPVVATASQPPPVVAAAPPPAPVKHVLPAGAVLNVRLIDSLDSSR